MPGEKSFGFHEGSRSEYLAQYVFASWGTAVVVPQQEDHGIDLQCTLMQRIGGRFLAKSPYTIQVKSEMKPVVYEGEEAVRWVIEQPLPFFLCIVNKSSGRLSVYHTLPRFHAWSLGQWPDRLSMMPVPAIPGKEGTCLDWPGSYDLSLDQPILDFSIDEMLDETFWRNAREVFEYWIEVENYNLTRVRTRLPTCRAPLRYMTNILPMEGWKGLWLACPNDDQFDQTAAGIKESVAWIGGQLRQKGDLAGAAKAALLHRHLFPEEHDGPLSHLQIALNQQLGLGGKNYLYAGVDRLGGLLQEVLGVGKDAADGSG